MGHFLKREMIGMFEKQLMEEEKEPATVVKYVRDVTCFWQTGCSEAEITKEFVVEYKKAIMKRYAVTTVNGILASLNNFFKKMEWYDCVVKSLKVQRDVFRAKERELTKEEYLRLVESAKNQGNKRLYYLIQTLGATGIRISELRFITVEAVRGRRAHIYLKGKNRMVLLPAVLCKKLERYIKEKGVKTGSIFVTKNGKPVDRSNVFREMKALCTAAKVDERKVFPHNLRHLFACCYYKAEKDIAHLADILGHSSIETTRIYLTVSWEEQEKKIEKLKMVQ